MYALTLKFLKYVYVHCFICENYNINNHIIIIIIIIHGLKPQSHSYCGELQPVKAQINKNNKIVQLQNGRKNCMVCMFVKMVQMKKGHLFISDLV